MKDVLVTYVYMLYRMKVSLIIYNIVYIIILENRNGIKWNDFCDIIFQLVYFGYETKFTCSRKASLIIFQSEQIKRSSWFLGPEKV